MPKKQPNKIPERKNIYIKIDLARNIAERKNIHTKDAETFLTTFTNIVSDSLTSVEPVRLSGFGTFDIRHVAAHEARNIRNGEPIQVHCHTLPPLPGWQDTESRSVPTEDMITMFTFAS